MSDHHITWRSRGGGDGPTIVVCNHCHARLNGEKTGEPEWDATIEADEFGGKGIITKNRKTGEVVSAYWQNDGIDEGLLVAEFTNAPQGIMGRVKKFKYLSDDGIERVGEALALLGTSLWIARGVLGRVAQLHSPDGGTLPALVSLAQQTGVSLRTVYRDIEAIKAAERTGIEFDNLANYTAEAVRMVAAQADPEQAKELLEIIATEAVIVRPGAFRMALAAGGQTQQPTEIEYHACPDCGQRHVKRN